MSHRTSSIAALLGVGAALAALLVGCATGAPGGPGSATPQSVETDGAAQVEVDAAWLDAGRLIGVVTLGSSTCVPMADTVDAEGQTITVALVDPDAEACTADLAPRVSLVAVPSGVDVTEDITIVTTGAVEGQGSLDGLDDATGTPGEPTDYLPSAGWTATDGQFVLLSWGSSSCAPVVESAAVTAPDEVTVTLVAPEANQVCTMDMAPRATLVHVDGDVDDDAFVVIPDAPEFDNMRIPILG